MKKILSSFLVVLFVFGFSNAVFAGSPDKHHAVKTEKSTHKTNTKKALKHESKKHNKKTTTKKHK